MSENLTKTGTKAVGWNHRRIVLDAVEVMGRHFLLLPSGALASECHRCAGEGGFVAYLGLHGGICYGCNGSGLAAKTFESVEKAVKSIKAAERRAAREQAKRDAETEALMAERAAWQAANPEIAARLGDVFAEVYAGHERFSDAAYESAQAGAEKYNDFILLMANYASYKALTEAQTDAVIAAFDDWDAAAKAAEKAAAEQAEKVAQQRYLDAAIGAKVTVTGDVVVATTIETQYGSSRLVIVEGAGDFTGVTFKMFGTGATLWETRKGEQVEVTATVKDFEEYNGTRQTVLTRAKIKTLATA